MTRSFIRDMSSRLKTAFSGKNFKKKPESYNRKVKTPPDYYRSKARQQSHDELDLSPGMKGEYLKIERSTGPKGLKGSGMRKQKGKKR